MKVHTRRFDRTRTETTVFGALLRARRQVGGRKIAVQDADDRRLAYDDIIKGAFALGSAFRRLTRPNEIVGVMLPTSVAAVVTFFALSVHGRTPAMINFTAGERNIRAALRTGQIRTLITAKAFVEAGGFGDLVAALGSVVRIVYLEDIREKLTAFDKLGALAGAAAPDMLQTRSDSNSPAVVLFTSGTEGDPKGVVLSHANLIANVEQILAHVPDVLTPADVIFNALPTFHCFGLTAGVLLPLLGGMKVVMHPTPLQTKIIPQRIRETSATILFGTDTFVSQWVRASSQGDFASLRYVVCGAERVRDETRQLVTSRTGVVMLEGYGATEAAPVIAVNQPAVNRPGTVGRPLPAMEVRFEPVEGIAAGGRLFVRGPNVMSGYLDSKAPGVVQPLPEGWHDTGDVVDQDEEGFLTIRGRLKRFAKVGGEMVSLAVVENCASALWRDHDHAAAVLPDKRKGEQIVLLTTNPEADRADLVRWAQSHGVSELALPRRVHVVEAIPLLGTGKLDIGGVQRLAVQLQAANDLPDGSRAAE